MDSRRRQWLRRAVNLLLYFRRYGPTAAYLYARYVLATKKQYRKLPTSVRTNKNAHIGILGCGKYSFTTICYYLRRNCGNVIRGVANRSAHKAISLAKFYGANYYTTDFARVIADDAINLIFIATNNASHAEYAIQALNSGKSIHIEKPPVVNRDQLNSLCEAMSRSAGSVNWGYCRPESKFGKKISEALERESGPMMINWFVATHVPDPEEWDQNPEEGGFFYSHMCHFIDYTLSLIPEGGRFPAKIHPCASMNHPDSLILSYEFFDGSLATISGAAKGRIFKGSSERLNISRGEAVITMNNFHRLTIKAGAYAKSFKPLFQDFGHQENIMKSYFCSRDGSSKERAGLSIKTLWESCNLLLLSQEALRTGRTTAVAGFDSSHQLAN